MAKESLATNGAIILCVWHVIGPFSSLASRLALSSSSFKIDLLDVAKLPFVKGKNDN